MKIVFALDTILAFQSGIWFHRNETPTQALKKRGHAVRQIPIGARTNKEITDWADVVIFGRTYPVQLEPIKLIIDLKKTGKRVLFDIDDDMWTVAEENPSHLVSNAFKDQYEGLIREADAVITPSRILAQKVKKFRKPVFICPNGIDEGIYHERPKDKERKELVIGYMGASSHWKDLIIVTKALQELYKKHDFSFDIYGMTSEPLEAAMYWHQKMLDGNYQPEKNEYFKASLELYDGIKKLRGRHYPFMPPELHPAVLSRCDFDIGLAPLEDTEFNKGKSDIKFSEYVSTGTVCLASDIEPYKSSGTFYRAKNNWKDWYNKLEKLIVDKKFREDLFKKQQEWVKKYRSLDALSLLWEVACQKPVDIVKVRNQKRWKSLLKWEK